MAFGDEDLKRLKDNLEWDQDFVQVKLPALIARLEAAEYALMRYSIIPDEYTTSGIRDAVAAWHKVAGR